MGWGLEFGIPLRGQFPRLVKVLSCKPVFGGKTLETQARRLDHTREFTRPKLLELPSTRSTSNLTTATNPRDKPHLNARTHSRGARPFRNAPPLWQSIPSGFRT